MPDEDSKRLWQALSVHECPVCREEYKDPAVVEFLEMHIATPYGEAKAVLCPSCSEAYKNSGPDEQTSIDRLVVDVVINQIEQVIEEG